jgi:hypothetical protein
LSCWAPSSGGSAPPLPLHASHRALLRHTSTTSKSMLGNFKRMAKASKILPFVTPQFQIWLSSTRTLSKTRTRTNPAYAFVLTSRKRVNPGVEMHLALGFICWWDSPSTSKVGQFPTHVMPLTLGPLVGSNSSLLGRDVTIFQNSFS